MTRRRDREPVIDSVTHYTSRTGRTAELVVTCHADAGGQPFYGYELAGRDGAVYETKTIAFTSADRALAFGLREAARLVGP
jgi:hypothetical protein